MLKILGVAQSEVLKEHNFLKRAGSYSSMFLFEHLLNAFISFLLSPCSPHIPYKFLLCVINKTKEFIVHAYIIFSYMYIWNLSIWILIHTMHTYTLTTKHTHTHTILHVIEREKKCFNAFSHQYTMHVPNNDALMLSASRRLEPKLSIPIIFYVFFCK